MSESKLRQLISSSLFIPEKDLSLFIARAPVAYKSFFIAKKDGGFRKINQPAKETKKLQRWVIEKVFSHLDIHDCAMAYRAKVSIKDNALVHSNNKYFLKLDFENFFGSIKSEDIQNFLHDKKIKLDDDDVRDLARILCIKDEGKLCLSVGAPSSPAVSNAILYAFDEEISFWCLERKIAYTRYADDLTFSTKEQEACYSIKEKVKSILESMAYPRLKLNESKTLSLSKKNNIKVTGITVTSDNKISIGRKRKRFIRSQVYKYKKGELKPSSVPRLRGLIAFFEHIEPGAISKLEMKFGKELMVRVVKGS
ncbi:retron St85 family RNA-directed DNA polymerase [Kushneria phyllosphaerae]|uniref:RNA-directed DNA polymerase n=1 Tax=Kushneria phyllosphaerae TaxID=2100822 RepID=A0A2R8CHX0_9GAMM|nr:retron St85 family RNA-directed DNA polymerase [Kushneria phyllosphaerae]SPJ32488.1 hypothetical protein KSP9073_00489 [Kushneria phyllosphaerae]